MIVSSYGKRLGPFGSGRTLQYRIIRLARRWTNGSQTATCTPLSGGLPKATALSGG